MKDIKILISCHKDSATMKNIFTSAIQVGADISKNKLENCQFFDNDGDNISSKNKRYCELTAQYYAWKNLDADYYGFFHYRRYLNFSNKTYPKWPLFEVKMKDTSMKNLQKFGLTEENMEKVISQYDVNVTKRSFCVSNYYHYKTANGHHIRDLDFCLQVIKNDYPHMWKSAKKYMRSGFAYFCNMFIMKKEIFNNYSQWLFDILKKHEDKYPCLDYNTREYRVSGFLAERLCGIYITYLKSLHNVKIKELQRVKIKNTEPQKIEDKNYDYLIVGAGLFGAVCAHELAKQGKQCLVIDKRNHQGGNLFCEKTEGINVHKYGAHIFHTSNEKIWNYVNNFVKFNNFINSPMAIYKKEIYNLPFNMNTFAKIWGGETRSPQQAKAKIEAQRQKYYTENPSNLEEQALNLVGKDVYEKLIKGYTEKQWGRDCKDLPAFIIKRLPLRFTYDNNYFNDRFQGIPIGGYNELIRKLLSSSDVRLNTSFENLKGIKYKNLIYTGAIDEFFGYKFGKLEYRTVTFKTEVLDTDNYQGVAVVNYTEREVPYTRIIEHKHFEFGKQEKTVISKEYPTEWKEGLEPYYPVNDDKNTALYQKYLQEASKLNHTYFGGRLGQYKYFDMDKTIEEALKLVEKLK